jgi:broad specificity phosphatase PhoE
MKRIYFVRHGESTSNTQNLIQGLGDPLTEEGERQARVVALRVKDLKIDVLIASDAVRAQGTATAISDETGLAIETSPLFREGKRPSSLVGQSRANDSYRELIAEMQVHAEDPSWRHEDEENYHCLLYTSDAADDM